MLRFDLQIIGPTNREETMSITTRSGWRKSQVAKQYQADVWKKLRRTTTLRQARKEWAVIERLLTILKPLGDRNAVRVLKAVAILTDTHVNFPIGIE